MMLLCRRPVTSSEPAETKVGRLGRVANTKRQARSTSQVLSSLSNSPTLFASRPSVWNDVTDVRKLLGFNSTPLLGRSNL